MASPTPDPTRNTNAVLTASLASSALVLAATLFRTNSRDLTFTLSPFDTFGQAFSLAGMQVAIYLVALIGLGFLGFFRNWWLRLAAGFIAMFVGSTIAYLVQVLSNGLELNGTAWATIFSEFFGLMFPFAISGLIMPVLVVEPVLRAVNRERIATRANTGERSAFVRVPAAELYGADSNVSDRADAQWEAMVAAFDDHDWGTSAVTGEGESAAAMLVGDLALVLGERVVFARPIPDERRAEFESLRSSLEQAGGVIDELEAPAEFDPADVVDARDVLYVGVGSSTNTAGLRALRAMTDSLGRRVIGVPVAEGMHLSDVLSVLPDGTRVIWAPAILQTELIPNRFEVLEPHGAALVALDERTVMMSASAPLTADLVRSLGFEVIELELDALEAAGATLPRLSLRSVD